MSLRALLVIVFAVSSMTACKTKEPKSKASIYQGDGPSVRYYNEPETAGGPVRTTHYR